MKQSGIVVAAYGRQYRVELDGGPTQLCDARGKRGGLVCGDRVTVLQTASGVQGVIVAHEPRGSLFYRSDVSRQKLIAANVTQVIIVVATEPPFSDELVTRCTVAAEAQNIAVLIVLNKCDLGDRLGAAIAVLEPFVRLGYRVLRISARSDGARQLLPMLAGETSLLIGQSGMGKSTLINALVPGARAATREISQALHSGRHTTTCSHLYRPAPACALIDSPGLTDFGLRHLTVEEIAAAFVEFRPLADQCRFRDCHHHREPDCRIRLALEEGNIDPRRYAAFLLLCSEAAQRNSSR
ncbi:ribosome small subunit-dependent GTPase A [Accumulibacter sp.]|uniref:ribosome small subunit-dependent GTPase A n=1 Tax=Accumulibacter sp. TaxID=2053492 RepID=UPI0025D233F1|nr:ribosome small subunit-dependent GTPase A [Accumulibacter sp.]MCM8594535.1 ribosome small subunit-dependent GTPase A [Accumulibacter sp.]MCM8627383.1 ribosome small subunit-dependent GTPase A [Accumulibacter sp.]MDS4048681.1 ribosome small subunit-dependent GTPase A [Accumulibacter sp.]